MVHFPIQSAKYRDLFRTMQEREDWSSAWTSTLTTSRLFIMLKMSPTTRTFLYWNVVSAVLIICLGVAVHLRRMHRFDRLIVESGRIHNVDPRLISCVIWTESRFDPTRVGQANEVGLMQISELVAREWAIVQQHEPFSIRDFFNPKLNIQAGSWYLAQAIKNWSDYDDPLPYALAAYNAGQSNARRWAQPTNRNARVFWENITYPTTKRYVRDILERYRGGV